MKKEDLKNRLEAISNEIRGIIGDSGIWYDTSLFAYLNMADQAVLHAVVAYKEYDEEAAERYSDKCKD